MRFYLSAFALASIGLATYLGQTNNRVMDGSAAKLKGATSLTVSFTSQTIPGTPVSYKLTFGRPNLVKVESDDRLIESDGKTIWDFDKKANSYTETPFDADAFNAKIQSNLTWAWAGFFLEQPYKGLSDIEDGNSRMLKGAKVSQVSFKMDPNGAKQGTLMVAAESGVATGIDIKHTVQGAATETLVIADSVKLSSDNLSASDFTFVAPAGAQRVEAVAPSAGALTYADVQPIFKAACSGCHGRSGGLSVATYDSLMAGGQSGPCIVAGNPDGSSLIGYLKGTIQPKMPKGGTLSDDEIQKISAWIKAGAKP